jgi:rod shape-determining protein MreB and related proteins
MKHPFARLSRTSGADIAIDLGTANTLVVKRDAGVIFNEASICCFEGSGTKKRLVAAGAEANEMVGRVTRDLRITRPLRGGVLSDMDAGRELIRYAIRNSRSGWIARRPKALIGVPADATEAERRALTSAAQDAGIAKVELIDEPLLAAIGSGLDVDAPRGRMLVDCGAGTTEVVVISLGTICLSKSTRIGGDTLDAALVDHLHLRHRFQVGPIAAEALKLKVTQLLDEGRTAEPIEIRGQNLASGLPETIKLPCRELLIVYERHLHAVVETVRAALHDTPPELSNDILEDGLTLTGGASMVQLLSRRISEATGLSVSCPPEPLHSVAQGLEMLLQGTA